MSGPALIVGLGNPGSEYERSRHNLGYRVVDILASRFGTNLRAVRGIRAFAGDAHDGDRKLILAKPTTYMNESGEAVRELARYYKVAVEDIVVVHDELDLPFGALKVKRDGGDAGHNGLKHITRALGSSDYARVRIGIGKPPGRKSGADHVLSALSKKEEEAIGVVLEEAADAALSIVREGVEATQNQLHGGEPKTKPRRLRRQAVIDAPLQDVWDAWTTPDGAKTFFAPEAKIELREGGPYEIYFNVDQVQGLRGSEGCEVISFQAPHSLAFSWNNPPILPSIRNEHTTVDVSMRSAGKDRTRVTLTHSGWGEGEDWDHAFEYFERAWDIVLGRLQRRFAEGPIDWSASV